MNGIGRFVPAAVLAVLVGGLVACDRLPGAATDLQVGDCFDEPEQTTTDISEIQHQPCDGPHDAEVFAVVNHPAPQEEPYPIISGVDDFVESDCLPIFDTYTGLSFATQEDLDVGWFYPTLSGWRSGDREVTCYLVSATEGEKLTGSFRVAAP